MVFFSRLAFFGGVHNSGWQEKKMKMAKKNLMLIIKLHMNYRSKRHEEQNMPVHQVFETDMN